VCCLNFFFFADLSICSGYFSLQRSIQKEEAKKKEVHIDENVPAPSPRSNCSLTINPLKDTELVLYGGEFYNGSKTFVYGDLYRYDVEKNEWKLVSSPNSPPPRSAHQTVAWKNNIYMFGGEFTSPNQERFHHYKDFWSLDLKTNQWEQILAKGCPSARSGHRMVSGFTLKSVINYSAPLFSP
jgi:N-acetylneuraminic acid mutarotase